MEKAIRENLKFEENLEVFYYDHSDHSNKKWNFTLRFSFYQEAYEYVKSKQREDFDFNDKINKMRNHTKKRCDLIAPIKKADNLEKKFDTLEAKMDKVLQLLGEKAGV